MKIKAVLLDFGNVLGRFRHMTACEKLAEFTTADAESIRTMLFGSTNATARQVGKRTGREFFAFVQDFYETSPALTYELFAELWGDIFTPAPGLVLHALYQLRTDVVAAIASNTEVLHWPYIERLETVQCFFDEENRHIVKSYEVGYEKPDERFFLAALDMIGVTDPGQVLFIDDVQENVDAFVGMGGYGEVFDLTKDDPGTFALILETHGLFI